MMIITFNACITVFTMMSKFSNVELTSFTKTMVLNNFDWILGCKARIRKC